MTAARRRDRDLMIAAAWTAGLSQRRIAAAVGLARSRVAEICRALARESERPTGRARKSPTPARVGGSGRRAGRKPSGRAGDLT